MKRQLIALVLCLLAFAATAHGQTTATLVWDYNVPLSEVQGYTQAITIDGTALTTAPTCVAATPTSTRCQVPAPSLATGTHTVAIAATRNGITATTIVNGVGTAGAPTNPSNPKLNIVITINIGG